MLKVKRQAPPGRVNQGWLWHAKQIAQLADRWYVSLISGVGGAWVVARAEAGIVRDSARAAAITTRGVSKKLFPFLAVPASPRPAGRREGPADSRGSAPRAGSGVEALLSATGGRDGTTEDEVRGEHWQQSLREGCEEKEDDD